MQKTPVIPRFASQKIVIIDMAPKLKKRNCLCHVVGSLLIICAILALKEDSSSFISSPQPWPPSSSSSSSLSSQKRVSLFVMCVCEGGGPSVHLSVCPFVCLFLSICVLFFTGLFAHRMVSVCLCICRLRLPCLSFCLFV